jgi:DeoR/GlpR family transcriptional regulator of sugar metabolism
MLAPDRQRRILDILEREESATTAQLREECRTSAMTLWRDLGALEERGLLRRIHGGAVRVGGRGEPRYEVKALAGPRVKRRIAARAAELFLRPGQSLILEGGTTVSELVPHLPPGDAPPTTVLTNSVPILARIHAARRPVQVWSSGGLLSPISGNFIGTDAVAFFREKRADVFFMSATGVDAARGITDPNPQEIEVKRAMADASTRVILLADATKIGHVSLQSVLSWERIHCLVTGHGIAAPALRALKKVVPRIEMVV